MVMAPVILKTLENRLKEKVGQTVQSLDIISQEFIVVMITGLKTLTNFDVVKWFQVTKVTVKYYATKVQSNSLDCKWKWFRAPPLPSPTAPLTARQKAFVGNVDFALSCQVPVLKEPMPFVYFLVGCTDCVLLRIVTNIYFASLSS